jgi:hypothetical protein
MEGDTKAAVHAMKSPKLHEKMKNSQWLKRKSINRTLKLTKICDHLKRLEAKGYELKKRANAITVRE